MQALDWVKQYRTDLPLITYYEQQAIKEGIITQRLLEKLNAARDPDPACPKCGGRGGPQYGRRCCCNHCGNKWELPNPLDVALAEPIRYTAENGDVLDWDDDLKLWVDTVTGKTYEPGS